MLVVSVFVVSTSQSKSNYDKVSVFEKKTLDLFLENINLVLAFFINIISQPIEHLNISLKFIYVLHLIRKCT